MKNYIGNWLILPIIFIYGTILKADDSVLATITVKEIAGYSRDLEYVECTIQVSKKNLDYSPPKFITEDILKYDPEKERGKTNKLQMWLAWIGFAIFGFLAVYFTKG